MLERTTRASLLTPELMRTMAQTGALLPFVTRKPDLFPTDMAEVLGIVSIAVGETKGFASGLARFLYIYAANQ